MKLNFFSLDFQVLLAYQFYLGPNWEDFSRRESLKSFCKQNNFNLFILIFVWIPDYGIYVCNFMSSLNPVSCLKYSQISQLYNLCITYVLLYLDAPMYKELSVSKSKTIKIKSSKYTYKVNISRREQRSCIFSHS